MTTTLSTDLAASIVSEIGGSDATSVKMMIGIGLNKDSEAVYFQYLGDEQKPQALMMPSGKPCTRMANMRLVRIEIVDGIGIEKVSKLNVYLGYGTNGDQIMLTSGLNTWWTQCFITGAMGMYQSYNHNEPFTLDSYKGKTGRRPVFCTVRQGGAAISDQLHYDTLNELRRDRAWDKHEATIRDAVSILNAAVTGGPIEEAVVSVEEGKEGIDF